MASCGVRVADHPRGTLALVGASHRGAPGRRMAWAGVAQVNDTTGDVSHWLWAVTRRTLAGVAMVLGKADGVFAASIITNIKASMIQSVAGLVCGAVLINETDDGAAAMHGIVGVASE